MRQEGGFLGDGLEKEAMAKGKFIITFEGGQRATISDVLVIPGMKTNLLPSEASQGKASRRPLTPTGASSTMAANTLVEPPSRPITLT
ncbi:MAG: hypothetical protein BJ554DRAFT_5369 [Olpidium bornovanus]|uniref:Uncharacterized protein n=1 Tax=Olpidium bornovanus TaxID=278681 RepID=A0A8H8A2D7_9FUNG|nr:MAG: hypothetical protein BJ554DRAFT_5369 [Olpidium bornovanus]